MTERREHLEFDHIHLISENPRAAAEWYRDLLDAEIVAEYETRRAPQIAVRLGGITLLIRGQRAGESPGAPVPMRKYADYSSHNTFGTDHFGFTYRGDLKAYCSQLKTKGATFAVEPWEFTPGNWLCYLSAPDSVSIEIVEGK